jgi:hypothetical protein
MKTKINFLLILVLAGFVLAGCSSMNHCGSCKTQQWEYKLEVISNQYGISDHDSAKLNQLGQQGWILVSTIPISVTSSGEVSESQFIFRRPKQ